MKLFFYAPAVLLTIAVLSGCGASEKNGSAGNMEQMAEVTIQGSAIPEKDSPGLFQTNDAASGFSAKPLSPFAAAPERVVAENVMLGRESIGGLTEALLAEKLAKAAAKTDKEPVDAGYDPDTWAVKKEKAGKRLDTEKILHEALAAGKGDRVDYSYLAVKPAVKAGQLKKKIKLIGKYSTPFLDRSKPRIRNIRRASRKLDGKIILPGQEFSFNRTTGSKSIKAGYEKATVIVRTPKGPIHKKAPGGGVCQVSTTLYNAVLKSGLKVTERHEHSDDVYYVPDGKDATVTYKGPDFRFVNTRRNPVMIRVYVGKRTLQVRIYENTGIRTKSG